MRSPASPELQGLQGERRDSNPRPPGPQPGDPGSCGGASGSVEPTGFAQVGSGSLTLRPRMRPRSYPAVTHGLAGLPGRCPVLAEGPSCSAQRGIPLLLEPPGRPAGDLDAKPVRVEDEELVEALDVSILLGREVDRGADVETALIGGVYLLAESRRRRRSARCRRGSSRADRRLLAGAPGIRRQSGGRRPPQCRGSSDSGPRRAGRMARAPLDRRRAIARRR